MDGFIIIDKPEGITSHDVVSSVRRILKQKKVGHTGTLDPFATGVLPIALGEATKAIPYLDEATKEYLAVMHLGKITVTLDRTGEILQENSCSGISENMIREAFSFFTGAIKQVPPMFSALKRSGVPLYKLARQGKMIEREPRDIHIFSLEIEKIAMPRITFRVRCSRGTYVRALASDLGDRLGCGAHLCELCRISSGMFTLKESISLEILSLLNDKARLSDKIISPYCSLSHYKDLALNDNGAEMVRNGAIPDMTGFQQFPQDNLQIGEKVTLSHNRRLLAVAENISFPWCEGQKNMKILRGFKQAHNFPC